MGVGQRQMRQDVSGFPKGRAVSAGEIPAAFPSGDHLWHQTSVSAVRKRNPPNKKKTAVFVLMQNTGLIWCPSIIGSFYVGFLKSVLDNSSLCGTSRTSQDTKYNGPQPPIVKT
jgi:hypothetical protein